MGTWHYSKCYKRKGDSLGKGNYRGLKLTDEILRIAKRITEKFTRQQVSIDKVQLAGLFRRGGQSHAHASTHAQKCLDV